MKRVLHRCGCCGTHYDPAFNQVEEFATRCDHFPGCVCPGCGCAEYEEVLEDDVE